MDGWMDALRYSAQPQKNNPGGCKCKWAPHAAGPSLSVSLFLSLALSLSVLMAGVWRGDRVPFDAAFALDPGWSTGLDGRTGSSKE